MAIRYPDTTRTAAITPVRDAIDAGTTAGKVEVYSGAQPASANNAATGTLLVTLTLNDPSGTVSAGVLTIDTTTAAISAAAVASGTAGWARVKDSNGNTIFDGSCGTAGSGADFIINTTAITSGGTVSLNSGTLTQGAG